MLVGTRRVNNHAVVTDIEISSNKNYLRNLVKNKGAEVIHVARSGDHLQNYLPNASPSGQLEAKSSIPNQATRTRKKSLR